MPILPVYALSKRILPLVLMSVFGLSYKLPMTPSSFSHSVLPGLVVPTAVVAVKERKKVNLELYFFIRVRSSPSYLDFLFSESGLVRRNKSWPKVSSF